MVYNVSGMIPPLSLLIKNLGVSTTLFFFFLKVTVVGFLINCYWNPEK